MLNHIPFFLFLLSFFFEFLYSGAKIYQQLTMFGDTKRGSNNRKQTPKLSNSSRAGFFFRSLFFNYPLSPLDVFCVYRVIIVMKQSSTTMQKDQLVNAAHLCNCTALYMVDQKGPAAQAISKPMGTQLIGMCKAQRKRNFVQGILCLTNIRIEIRYYGTIIMKIGNLSIAKFNVACQRKGLLRRRRKLPRERCTCRD